MTTEQPNRRGVKLAVKMLKKIQQLGYRECSLREYERRQEGQVSGEQRDVVGDYLRQAGRDPDPQVLAGMTALLTDYLMSVMEGVQIDLEAYDDLDTYLQDHTALIDADMSRPQ